ncbi:unnamed protein product [Adineta ricciae]|uniref:Uncharacterized protein n=1 Tax=Adineta ricciae TaxID=249248 RepID=A0A813QLC2_ADIRI|nr:unnamed protein product [Adineta ricciae]
MLLTILTRMSNDEQRLQLLQTLRNKLSSYRLTWLDIRNMIRLFSPTTRIRFDILQFFLLYMKNFSANLEIEDYIDLYDLCTNDNEQMKVRLFELIYEKLNTRNQQDVERILSLFQTAHSRQKIEGMLRNYRSKENLEQYRGTRYKNIHLLNFIESILLVVEYQQCTAHPGEIAANRILSPTLSSAEQLFVAPLKRKYSYDYQDQSCRQVITPILYSQQEELIQQRDILSISSSNSSISSTSGENVPIRTRSFMIAIKNTFECLRETSS